MYKKIKIRSVYNCGLCWFSSSNFSCCTFGKSVISFKYLIILYNFAFQIKHEIFTSTTSWTKISIKINFCFENEKVLKYTYVWGEHFKENDFKRPSMYYHITYLWALFFNFVLDYLVFLFISRKQGREQTKKKKTKEWCNSFHWKSISTFSTHQEFWVGVKLEMLWWLIMASLSTKNVPRLE